MIGRTISHYTILRQIGRGGMGVVYEAQDLRLGRHCALKVLEEEHAVSEDRARRLLLEARAASALNHPNICTIYEADEEEGRPFFAMELLEGDSLDYVLLTAPFSAERVVELSLQVASALSAAHAKGMVHRDIKPGNLFLTRNDQIKVLDFGLAKVAEAWQSPIATTIGSSPMTSTGTVMGTVAYMSPEQARGDDLDGRSDLFSLGVVMYQMASGKLPFDGKTSAVVFHAILGKHPQPLLEIAPSIPVKLAEIVEKLLEKDLLLRYQSAADLVADLKRLQRELLGLGAVSGEYRRPTEPVRAITPAPSFFASPRLWILTLALAVLVVVVVIGQRDRNNYSFQRYSVVQATPYGDVQAAALSPDGHFLLLVREMRGKQSLWFRNVPTNADTQVMPPSDDRYLAVSFSPDGDYLYFVREASPAIGDLYRAPVLGGTPQRVLHDVESDISFSPDGKQLAFIRNHAAVAGSGSHEIVVADVNGEHQRVLHPSDSLYFGASWSPDGKRLVVSTQNRDSSLRELMTVDVASGTESKLFGSNQESISEAHWHPAGRGLVVTYRQKDTGFSKGQIGWISYPKGELKPVTLDTSDYHSASIDASGERLASILRSSSFDLALVDYSGNTIREARPSAAKQVSRFVSWADNDHILLDEGSRIVRMRPDGSDRTVLMENPQHKFVTGPIPCAQGRYIVFTAVDEKTDASQVWRMNADGSEPLRLTEGPNDFAQFCLPGESAVYVLDETTNGIERVPISGGEPQHLPGPTANSIAGSSPDGSRYARFAFVDGKHRLFVLDAATGTILRTLDPDADVADVRRPPHFTPDGAHIAYVVRRAGADNIYMQPIEGGKGRMLTNFPDKQIRDFAFSPDGKRLALLRGQLDSDVVVFTDSKR